VRTTFQWHSVFLTGCLFKDWILRKICSSIFWFILFQYFLVHFVPVFSGSWQFGIDERVCADVRVTRNATRLVSYLNSCSDSSCRERSFTVASKALQIPKATLWRVARRLEKSGVLKIQMMDGKTCNMVVCTSEVSCSPVNGLVREKTYGSAIGR
jgi:hypothetical protein